jgi:hypothetical protein
VEVFGPGARGAPPAGCSVAIVDDVTTAHMLLKVGGGARGHRGWGLVCVKGGREQQGMGGQPGGFACPPPLPARRG